MADHAVLVTTDLRIPERDQYMGLEPFLEDPVYELKFRSPDRPDALQAAEVADIDVLLSIGCDVTAAALEDSGLRALGKFGSGMDQIDIEACTREGIPVYNSPQGIRNSVAQATLGYLVTCAHRFKEYDTRIRTVGFPDRHVLMGRELFGASLGIIGFGLIGRRVAELVAPFDMTVRVHDPYVDNASIPAGIERVGLDTLLETSEFVSLHCPLTDETEGLLDTAALQRMRDDAYLINTARGGIVRDETLARAIEEDWIAGAAIDVFETEPEVAESPLLDLEDCLLTPHIAGVTTDAFGQIGQLLYESTNTALDGGVPRNLLNPEVMTGGVPPEKLSPSTL
ncbi:MAG: 2-hydroxyacid dehydrogenase [Salinirussus sp.]